MGKNKSIKNRQEYDAKVKQLLCQMYDDHVTSIVEQYGEHPADTPFPFENQDEVNVLLECVLKDLVDEVEKRFVMVSPPALEYEFDNRDEHRTWLHVRVGSRVIGIIEVETSEWFDLIESVIENSPDMDKSVIHEGIKKLQRAL